MATPITIESIGLLVGFVGGSYGLYSAFKNNRRTDTKIATENAVKLTSIELGLSALVNAVAEIKAEITSQRETDMEVKQELTQMKYSINQLQRDFTDYKEVGKKHDKTVMDLSNKLEKVDDKVEAAFRVIDMLKEKVGGV